VVLPLLSGDRTRASETWEVKITAIRGRALRGKLAKPLGRARQRAGARIVFHTSHIHSLLKGRPDDG